MRVGALDHNGITEGSIWKPLLGFFFPIWMGTFFQQFYNTADAMIVGRFLGTSALAAVGATSSIVSLLVGFFVGLASGASVVIAQYYGARDRERLSASVHTAVILALVSGLFFMILGIGTARTILRIMQTPQDIMDDAMAYIRVYYMGMIPLMLYDMGTSILRALGDSRRPLYFLIASAIANILLDLLFVAVIPMGVTGAALATVLSEVLACVLTLMCLVKADGEPWQLRLKELRVSPMQLREMLRLGLPAGLQSILYTVSNMVIQASINSFGTATVASWTVYGKVDFVYWMTVKAMGLSVTTFAGQNFGAKKYDRMKKGTLIGLGILAVLTVIISSMMLLLARPLLGLFTEDQEVMNITLEMMHFLVPTYLTYICVEIFSGAVRGAGDVVAPTLMTCFGVCILRVLWILVAVPLHRTVVMVEWSYPITWTMTSVMYFIYYFHGGWLRRCIDKQSRTFQQTEVQE